MQASPPSAWRLRDTFAALAFAAATAAFTLYQNTRVAVLWDISFLLDTAWRFSLHQLPYKDLPFPYAPLTFLLHTAIIRLFGRVYYPHILYAALAGAAATLLTWRIALHILKPLPQSWPLALLLAAPLTVLGIYGIYPHPIYDSDTILAVLLTLYFLQRASTPARNALAGACAVLPLFFKQNIGLPFLLLTLACVATIAVARRRQRLSPKPQLGFLAASAATLAAALLTIHFTVGLDHYLHWTIAFAAQRRLPGLSVILGIYRQTSLLWTIPTAIAALILTYRTTPERMRYLAIALLAAPFLWTIFSLTLTSDPSDRADQFLALWPHLLLLAAVLALASLRKSPTFNTLLPLILLATIHGTFLSQQVWGSTYALFPLLTLLLAAMLLRIPTIAAPTAIVTSATFLLCGTLYALSHDRLSYTHLDTQTLGPPIRSTLPQLKGMATPGPYLPDFDELIRFTQPEIPANDAILLIPGQDPFYFATGRAPQFPILLFDPATNPYSPQQALEEARAHNIRWLIVNRNLQLTADPSPNLPAYLQALQQDFTPYRTLTSYDIYRRK